MLGNWIRNPGIIRGIRTADFQDANGNSIDDRDEQGTLPTGQTPQPVIPQPTQMPQGNPMGQAPQLPIGNPMGQQPISAPLEGGISPEEQYKKSLTAYNNSWGPRSQPGALPVQQTPANTDIFVNNAQLPLLGHNSNAPADNAHISADNQGISPVLGGGNGNNNNLPYNQQVGQPLHLSDYNTGPKKSGSGLSKFAKFSPTLSVLTSLLGQLKFEPSDRIKGQTNTQLKERAYRDLITKGANSNQALGAIAIASGQDYIPYGQTEAVDLVGRNEFGAYIMSGKNKGKFLNNNGVISAGANNKYRAAGGLDLTQYAAVTGITGALKNAIDNALKGGDPKAAVIQKALDEATKKADNQPKKDPTPKGNPHGGGGGVKKGTGSGGPGGRYSSKKYGPSGRK